MIDYAGQPCHVMAMRYRDGSFCLSLRCEDGVPSHLTANCDLGSETDADGHPLVAIGVPHILPRLQKAGLVGSVIRTVSGFPIVPCLLDSIRV